MTRGNCLELLEREAAVRQIVHCDRKMRGRKNRKKQILCAEGFDDWAKIQQRNRTEAALALTMKCSHYTDILVRASSVSFTLIAIIS